MSGDFARLKRQLKKYQSSLKKFQKTPRKPQDFTAKNAPVTRNMTPQDAGELDAKLLSAMDAFDQAIEDEKDPDIKENLKDYYLGKTELMKLLDQPLMVQARKAKAELTQGMRKATADLITVLKDPDVLVAFKAARAPEQLAIYRDLIPLIPVIDTFDPAIRSPDEPEIEMSLRFSQSGRVSVSEGKSLLSLETMATVFSSLKVRTSVDDSDLIVWTDAYTNPQFDPNDPQFKAEIARYKALFPKPKGWTFENRPGDLAGTAKVIYDLSMPVMALAAMNLEKHAVASAHADEMKHLEAIVATMLPKEADMTKALSQSGGSIAIDFKGALDETKATEFQNSMKQAKAAQFALSLKAVGVFDALYGFNKDALGAGTSADDKRKALKATVKLLFTSLDVAADVFTRVTGKALIGSMLGAAIAIPLLALDADAAYANIDAAIRAGDIYTAIGEGIALTGSTVLALASVFVIYAEFGAAASALTGPIGIAVTIIVGIALIVGGKALIALVTNTPIETFAKHCCFGKSPADQPDDPTKSNYGFGLNNSPTMGVQINRLFELQTPLGLSFDTRLKFLSISYNLEKILDSPKGTTIKVGWTKKVDISRSTLTAIPETSATKFTAADFWKGGSFLENIPANMSGAFVEAQIKLPHGAGLMRNWVQLPT